MDYELAKKLKDDGFPPEAVANLWLALNKNKYEYGAKMERPNELPDCMPNKFVV